MDKRNLNVRFTETADQEMALLVQETKILPLVDYLVNNNDLVPDDLKSMLVSLVSVVTDMFSSELPGVSANPEDTLRAVSRDINLSRVMRERGMFRMYRLINQRAEDGTALFMSLINPNTGSPFAKQEEFIGWFCESASVSRSLLFQRLAVIERLMSLDFSLDEAFKNILAKPYAMREVINMLASWRGGEIEHIDPQVALNVARRVRPDAVEGLEALVADLDTGGEDAVRAFHKAVKPIMADLIDEVADHDRAGDALNFVKHDVLMQSEVIYRWNEAEDILYVELHRQVVDDKTGEVSMAPPIIVPFIPDTTNLPPEIRRDIVRRLPIRNRVKFDLD